MLWKKKRGNVFREQLQTIKVENLKGHTVWALKGREKLP